MRSSWMKLTLIALIVFFELQFLSHLILDVIPLKERHRYPTPARISARFFPIDPYPKVVYAHGLLAAFCGDPNRAPVEKGIGYLDKAVRQNMLLYQAHFYLGKSYLCLNRPNTDDFIRGVSSLKKAASLRRGNLSVAIDTLKVMVPMWPLLSGDDRKFAADLLMDIAPKIKPNEMKTILASWTMFVGDFERLTQLLSVAPSHYKMAADLAVRKKIPLEKRYDLMARFEHHLVQYIREGLRDSKKGPADCQKQWISRWTYLKKNVRCYHALLNQTDFSHQEFADLRKFLQRNILMCLFAEPGWKSDPIKKIEIEDLLLEQIRDMENRDVIQYYDEFLQKRKFFNRSGIRNFYLQQLIAFKLNRFETVIFEIEDFGRSISYVKDESRRDYADLLLLLSEAYFSSRLLTKAQAVLTEVEKLLPGSEEVMWRRMKIEKILGPDNVYDNDQMRILNDIRMSRRFRPDRLPFRKTVYLLDSNVIEMSLDSAIRSRIEKKHLLQVFIDEKIFREMYLSDLGDMVRLEIPKDRLPAKLSLRIQVL